MPADNSDMKKYINIVKILNQRERISEYLENNHSMHISTKGRARSLTGFFIIEKKYSKDKIYYIKIKHNTYNYHHSVLRTYISMIAGKELHLFYEQNKPDSANIIFVTKGEERNPRLIYCDIMLTESVFEVKSDIVELSYDNILYIKRILYLSAIGQI